MLKTALRPKGIKRKPRKAKILRAGSRIRPAKAISISKLVQTADKLFSLRIRQLNASNDGTQICFTCGHKNHWKKLHAGHFLSRYYKTARWDEDNVKPQCFICNIYKKGDAVKFRENLVKEIGEERVKKVEAKRNETTKLTREFLTALIAELKTI